MAALTRCGFALETERSIKKLRKVLREKRQVKMTAYHGFTPAFRRTSKKRSITV